MRSCDIGDRVNAPYANVNALSELPLGCVWNWEEKPLPPKDAEAPAKDAVAADRKLAGSNTESELLLTKDTVQVPSGPKLSAEPKADDASALARAASHTRLGATPSSGARSINSN